MDSKKYYERHLRWGYIYYPYAGRLMDYLLARAETYPRCIDGTDVPPGRVFTSHADLCADIAIAEDEIPHAINELSLKSLVRITSYSATTICLTIVLDPDEITTPPEAPEISSTNEPTYPEVGSQYIAPAQASHPTTQSENTPSVWTRLIASAQPAQTPPNSPSLLNGSGQRPRQKPHSGDNFVDTGVSPCKSKTKRTSRVSGDIFVRVGVSPLAPPIKSPSKPRRGGIVLPSKTAPVPLPKHLNRPPALDPPVRGAPP